MQVRYALIPEDQGSYLQHVHSRPAYVVHRVVSVLILMVGAFLCLRALTLARYRGPFPHLSKTANAALCIVGTALALVVIVVIVHAAFALGRRFLPRTRPLPECTVRLASSGVSRTDGQGEALWEWTAVEQIVEGRRHIFVCVAAPAGVTASRVLIIPKRAFRDERHMSEFLDEIARFKAAATGAEPDVRNSGDVSRRGAEPAE